MRHRAFSYLDGLPADGATLKPCRLRYTGSADHSGFAIYRASHDDYPESIFPAGLPVGTCEYALDTTCRLYLGDPTAGPNPSRTYEPGPLRRAFTLRAHAGARLAR